MVRVALSLIQCAIYLILFIRVDIVDEVDEALDVVKDKSK